MDDIEKIKARIKWLEGEIGSGPHMDGYVLNGLKAELAELKKKLDK